MNINRNGLKVILMLKSINLLYHIKKCLRYNNDQLFINNNNYLYQHKDEIIYPKPLIF